MLSNKGYSKFILTKCKYYDIIKKLYSSKTYIFYTVQKQNLKNLYNKILFINTYKNVSKYLITFKNFNNFH